MKTLHTADRHISRLFHEYITGRHWQPLQTMLFRVTSPSLTLALNMPSLSFSRMVESLFIDEGSGPLDPNTLNVAMDALDNLHNQGRKVGVISHVQEMTEGIPVQIKVSKQNGGKSKVEIAGV